MDHWDSNSGLDLNPKPLPCPSHYAGISASLARRYCKLIVFPNLFVAIA